MLKGITKGNAPEIKWLRIDAGILQLRESSSALCAFGERPDYLGVQSNPPSLALCPPIPGCISTSEEFNDPTHYIPPWTYNPQDGPGRKNPASKEKAMAEPIDAINTTKPDNFTPRIVKQTEDYIYVEYSSPLVGVLQEKDIGHIQCYLVKRNGLGQ